MLPAEKKKITFLVDWEIFFSVTLDNQNDNRCQFL